MGEIQGLQGNIRSLQKDPLENQTWTVSGAWRLTRPLSNTSIGNITIGFKSNLTSQRADGSSPSNMVSLTDFRLSNSRFTDKIALLDGTALIIQKDPSITTHKTTGNKTFIPLHILLNSRVIRIWSESESFRKNFGYTPVYGDIAYDKDSRNVENQTSGQNHIHGLNTQYEAGPIVLDPNLRVELVTDEIEFPTHMAFLGNNDILVLEKNEGIVKHIKNGIVQNDPVLDAAVANGGERGMLGIAINKNNTGVHVFLYFTESIHDGDDVTEGKIPTGNKLYRYDFVNDKLVNPKLLLDLPSTPSNGHNGGKILLDHQGNVYVTIGDLNLDNTENSDGTITKAQNNQEGPEPDGRAGILRITEDGKPVRGVMTAANDTLEKYFAYGIRNSFGIAFDPLTGKLWDVENGPEYGDEINLVEAGFNSGWNKVQGLWSPKENSPGNIFSNYSDLVSFSNNGAYRQPELSWFQPTPALTSLLFLNTIKLGSNYTNNLMVGDFNNGNIYEFKLKPNRTNLILSPPLADKVVNSENETRNVIFAKGFGGITDMTLGPDGYLYVLSLFQSGANCEVVHNEPCIPYSKSIGGSIFRVLPKAVTK